MMDLQQYFKRIGFSGSFEKPDLATLKLIHKLHVMSIPFENLSIHGGEKIVMDLEVIFDKIINRSRGGWCLENNFLFGWVLQKMGYNSRSLSCKVFNTSLNDFNSLDTHLINKVVIDGKAYIADVSFGVSYQPWEPLELVSGKAQSQAAGVFCLFDKEGKWILEKTGRKPKVLNPAFAKSHLVNSKLTKPIYSFSLEPRGQDYFTETCYKLQTDPTTLFTNKSICSLQTPTGFKALIGWTFSQITYNPDRDVDFYDMKNISDEEVEKILYEEFNVKLANKLQPVDKTVMYTF